MSSRAAEISANLQAITARIVSAAESAGRDPEEITLIAVTKTFPVSDVKILYELGVRDFGEKCLFRNIEVAHEIDDAAFVLKSDVLFFVDTLVVKNDFDSLVENRH
jgi:uncharacterized pyridoxal phosphate-containing UPF0001 family protein